MIHVTYSNRTEELLAGAGGRGAAGAGGAGPWAPMRLVVPNRNVETYVKLGLAEALGIAANLEVSFLRGLLAGLAERVVPGGRLVDARQIEGHLLALLHDQAFLAAPALAPVREYLRPPAPRPTPSIAAAAQLAAELARAVRRIRRLAAGACCGPGASAPALADHPTLAGTEPGSGALWLAMFGAATGGWRALAAAAGYAAVDRWPIWCGALERRAARGGRCRGRRCTCSASRTSRAASTRCWRRWPGTPRCASTR